MEFAARFFARGNAVAAGGYVHRVNKNVIRENIPFRCASSSLPVVGGSSESHTGYFRFVHEEFWPESVLSFASSFTKAWHTQDDFEKPEEQRVHTTHVMAAIERVAVGKHLSIERASAYLRSVYRHREPTSIKTVHVELEELVIDGVRFTVTFDTELFSTLDTDRRLRDEYANNPQFVKDHGYQFQPGPNAPAEGQMPEVAPGYILVSLVQRIAWDGNLPEGAKVEGNVITWPDVGRIFLAEMLITGDSRRLTMVRLELGSPLQATMAFAETESNGFGAP